MKKIILQIFATVLLLQGFASCLDPIIVPGAASGDEAALERFSFTRGDNPGLSDDAVAVECNGYFFISVPEGADLASLAPAIQCPTVATVLIDGLPYTPGTAYDFSGGVHIVTVTAASNGRTAKYPIMVKNGDAYIDNQVYSFMNDFKVPGVSISIMKGTETVYSSGYGFADEETLTRTTPNHLFRVADISQQFCVLCIMRLREQGRIELDQQVFGEGGILNRVFKNVTPYHESITIRHLLSHSSGITKGLTDPAFNDSFRFYAGTSTPVPIDTLIQRTLDARPQPYDDGAMAWSAGMGFDYSNVGYCILQRAVEVVSGKDFESFLKEDVLEQMDISDTHIGGYRYERRSNECVYYSQDGTDGYKHPLRELAGAAGIITSTTQMMKVLSYIDGNDEIPDQFSHETLEEMYTPYRYDGDEGFHRYGLGWRINHDRLFQGGHYHGGDIAGSAALWAGGTDQGMSGAFLCNSRAYNSNDNGSMDDNMNILLNRFFNYFSK